MRRAVLTLSGTVAGLAALFSFKTHVPGAAPVAEPSTPAGLSVSAPPSPTAPASPSPTPSKTTKKAKPKASSSPTTAPPPPAPAKSSAPPKPSGTFTGPLEDTQYGAVQVKITVSNGKITDANGSLPQGGSDIGQNALPQLNQEVLTAQSANIQAVSGATYTSNGYIQSLQQAVDQAGL